jgi:hypothetical protein
MHTADRERGAEQTQTPTRVGLVNGSTSDDRSCSLWPALGRSAARAVVGTVTI